MDGRELKAFLEAIIRERGLESLTPDEIDYVSGKINYSTYLQRCYLDYCNSFKPQADQGAVYD